MGAEGGTGGSQPSFFLGPQIECSSISDYAVKIVKANKLDHGEPRRRTGCGDLVGGRSFAGALGKGWGRQTQLIHSSSVGSAADDSDSQGVRPRCPRPHGRVPPPWNLSVQIASIAPQS